MIRILIALVILSIIFNVAKSQDTAPKTYYKKIEYIPTPQNYHRLPAQSGSFAFYLRQLDLKQDNKVMLYNGVPKTNQNAQFAVLKIDVGTKDLQQCADAVMRLRGEYLYQQNKYNDIHFNFLSDNKPRYFNQYAGSDKSYKNFRKYMDYVFTYANTASLLKELKPVTDINRIEIGDVFIQKGTPYGHAIIVVDVAVNNTTGKKVFMLAQSYMPAQEIHILKNNNNSDLSPWYSVDFEEQLITPEWTFSKLDLHRF